MRFFEYDGKVINLEHVVRFKVVDYADGFHLICIMNATIQVNLEDEGELYQEDYF